MWNLEYQYWQAGNGSHVTHLPGPTVPALWDYNVPVPAPRLILASRSPRRASLLAEAGFTFEQVTPPLDDPAMPPAGDATEVARSIAISKWRSVLNDNSLRLTDHDVILTADTLIAYHDGSLAGTPTTRDEARRMIRRFLDADHDVLSAVAVGPVNGEPKVFCDKAKVAIGHVPDQELEAYLDTRQWRGKAGGYNLFERQQAGWPIRVTGEATTVVGLPMPIVTEQLARLGIRPANPCPTRHA